MRVATDVGGTFTDLVVFSDAGVRQVKVDTTPPNFDKGVINAIIKADLDPAEFDFFAHGSTVVINALLSRRGVRTGLVTTRGFRDVLEIARGNRPDLFNLAFRKASSFVPRHLRFEVTERLDSQGHVRVPVDLSEVAGIVQGLREAEVESVAVCFLHAYLNPEHERRVADEIRRLWPQVDVVTSESICREWREYERTSTTVLSAYIQPIARSYLQRLDERLAELKLGSPLYVMQSNGGVGTLRGTIGNPITMVESGPASGMLGAMALGNQIGEPNLVALDIGGTTAKCALIHEGKVRITTEYRIEWDRANPGHPIRTPVIELVEIGNGGGSIAWIDQGGRLHVGPQSAGASPGPASYGNGGTDVTTTDANLVLGRISPDLFLGGEKRPDMEAVNKAFEKLVARLGGTVRDVARGIVRIANANMLNALKLVSLSKGHDPRDFALIAFGGGGAMHAVALGEELMAKKVIIPVHSSVFSAWGMLMTDLRRDFLQTRPANLSQTAPEVIQQAFAELEAEGLERARDEGMHADTLRMERYADLRYRGQEHTVKVKVTGNLTSPADLAALIEGFHKAHAQEYSFRLPNDVEIVNYHVVAISEIDKQPLPRLARTGRDLAAARKAPREVDFDAAGIHRADVYDWSLLEPGMSFTGPAIVEDKSTSLVVTPGRQVRMDDFGNIHIEL
ncbi:hydantoinase/oxoprolinase family protein [Niveispirillum sp. KHB5.9]|uniref:hydantoinase/oxoprolinase family protein n=1 Tax=Niveispirillum sp. KHB5.9 TaxID=3400269 RepID=UPI003A83C5D9